MATRYLDTPTKSDTYPTHPDAQFPKARGDAITGDRYYSKEFAEREWEHMWKRVWHVGGRERQLEETGDFIVHNFKHESVIMIRQEDGSVRAFFNVCLHRGNRLVNVEEGGVAKHLTCPYHNWKWNIDGALDEVQDPEDFSRGNPCEKLRMKELPCETWGGFVFYSFDPNALPLMEYLDPIPTLLGNRDLKNWKRVVWLTLRVNTNWKFASDNFNESYHIPAVHPQFQPMIDDHYSTTIFEMYPNGHNRMIEKLQPSSRYETSVNVMPLWADVLKEWDLDPAEFEGKAQEARIALQQARRTLGPQRGYHYMAQLSDDELTDQFHHTGFPNLTLTGTPEGLHMFRTEPDAEDPNWSTFDYWYMVPEVEGMNEVATIYGMQPFEEAEHKTDLFTNAGDLLKQGDFLAQDLSLAVTQQQGLRSMGFQQAYLADQEERISRFHEVINDYLEGRR
ncbi:aromatic ring-hydroxylating oxygenase subunit alpha [Novosphingobium album (ex Hu et al. 2023)]|uniref:Aromatic ring-hydroxylating dioxygenase subunit alpha n=1 Tax=Novosphingobium album (ex Hu et al. 2023) TaxID=2930093 RepID=A0ABT0B130_9SPHN|nr:aromatic ring-hydroxylating dioxygenase subunit alpha [Novosphingobium album (ex Hu et al. 2023)]MCJ2178744.1 aromatic ring-hydroxylating dioxygenase subunit alpha [Novosphingobium album (ex Hu et al. 2023)]